MEVIEKGNMNGDSAGVDFLFEKDELVGRLL